MTSPAAVPGAVVTAGLGDRLLPIGSRAATPADRGEFVAAIRAAVSQGRGFAAGKIGVSEQAWLTLPLLWGSSMDRRARRGIEATVRHHCRVQGGVFPSDLDSMLEFAQWHGEAVRALDYLGLVGGRFESDLIAHHRIRSRTIHFTDTEPDRSIPADSAECYLPLFTGKRLLIISSMAQLLVHRAQRRTFEAVWAKTGKRWFDPLDVQALEYPFAYDESTQRRFGSSQGLFDWIVTRIDPNNFDVALIAGGGLGIPIAAAVKNLGKQCVALGGHLQVLFGVQGGRWRNDKAWQADYVTEAWIDVPHHYRPENNWGLPDAGAYW